MVGPEPSSGEITETGRNDSAYILSLHDLSAHLAALALVEVDHVQEEAGPDFIERLARDNYSFPALCEEESSAPRYCPSTSTNSSMAVTMASRTTFASRVSERTPSLVGGTSTLKSFSVRTTEVESVARAGPLDEDGFQIGGPVQPLRCLFSFLACPETFSSAEEWHTHSKAHFRCRTPPAKLLCAFQHCGWQSQEADGEEAWEDRRKHFLEEHNVFAECHVPWKKDPTLFQHLWAIRVVDSAQLQELRAFGELTIETAAYTSTEGESRHRDRDGRRPRTGFSYAPRLR